MAGSIPEGLSPEEEAHHHVRRVLQRIKKRFGRRATPFTLRRVADVYEHVAERLREIANKDGDVA